MALDFKNTKRVGLLAKLGRGHYSPELAARVRPAEPRIERAQYLKFVRAIFVLWRHHIHDQLIVASRADAKSPRPYTINYSNPDGSIVQGNRYFTTRETAQAAADRDAKNFPGGRKPHVTLRPGFTETIAETEPTIGARLLEADWDQLIDASGLPGMLDRIARSLADRNQTYFANILRVNPPKIGAQSDMISAFRRRNIALIKNAGHDMVADLNTTLAEANALGARHEEIARTIQERTNVGESRAKLIARDQTLKYNSSVHTAQAAAAGITEFTWSTSHDGAVRPTHAHLDGQRFKYDDPPVTNDDGDRNLPGEDYQCRCVAIPVIDLFAGIEDAPNEPL